MLLLHHLENISLGTLKSGTFAKAVVSSKPSEPRFYVYAVGIIRGCPPSNGTVINIARLWDLYNSLEYLGPKPDMQLC